MEVENKRFIVRYKNDIYDLSKFLLKHPGGVNTLIGLKNSDLTNRFMNTPPHSEAAKYLLKEYRLKSSASVKEDEKIKEILNGHNIVKENKKAEENYTEYSEKHHQKSMKNETNNNYNFSGLTDESMEVEYFSKFYEFLENGKLNMNFFWAIISFLLYIKIIIIILLTVPIISFQQWNRLFRHPVVDLIIHQIQAYFYIYMSLLLLLWFNSLRDMRLYSKAPPVSSPCKIEDSITLMEQKMNLYQAERNFFISGFSIFGTMLMSQLFKLFSQQDWMGHMVDWSKAMVPQIHKIAEHYSEWVNKPVDRPLKLFESWYLEMLTRTPWWIIPLFWIPIAAHLIYQESFINQNLHLKPSIIAMKFLSGILLWTFIEYILHRWIFHINLKGKNSWLCTLHFMIHGLHHKVPFDHHRLVFPVFPAILIASVVYVVCYYLLALSKITLAGGVCGYVCYDLMHYYLHYGDPKMSLIYQLKRSHYQHHFVHHDRGFGVSSTIWDYVFGTRIFLRKLGFLIKWKFQSP